SVQQQTCWEIPLFLLSYPAITQCPGAPAPMPDSAFHLAFPVSDLEATRHFYRDTLGCDEGRESDHWIDFDFHGHQITAHLREGEAGDALANPVDGDQVPVPHFGLILDWDDWHSLADRLRRAS